MATFARLHCAGCVHCVGVPVGIVVGAVVGAVGDVVGCCANVGVVPQKTTTAIATNLALRTPLCKNSIDNSIVGVSLLGSSLLAGNANTSSCRCRLGPRGIPSETAGHDDIQVDYIALLDTR